MRPVLILTAAAIASGAPAQQTAPAQRPNGGSPTPDLFQLCRPTAQTVATPTRARIRRLADMPPAMALRGVYNEVAGCSEPIVLRPEVGSPCRAD